MSNETAAKTIKKIAFVYDAVFPFVKGGGEKRYYELAVRLSALGYDVHIYGMQYWEGPKVIQRDGITYHGLGKVKQLYTTSGRRSISQALFFGIYCFKLFFEKFDVIDCCGFPYFSLFTCRFITWLRGIPLYSTWHEVWGARYWKEYLGSLGFIGTIVEKIAVKLPNTIISVSPSTTTALEVELGRTQNVITVENGVDLEKIRNSTASSTQSDVLFVGRLNEHKNLDLLIKAINILKTDNPEITCTIVGEGPEKDAVLSLIALLHLENNIRVLGKIASDIEVYGLMKSSKMLVLPSVREGFGLVAVEAMAAGIPVITTIHKDNATMNLISNGVNGYLASLSVEDIAQKIKEILSNSTQLQSANKIEQYDWKNSVNKIEQILQSLNVNRITSVTTSWDDGHVLDLRFAKLLRKYNLAGTFYISPLDHEFDGAHRLTPDQIRELSQDFEIGAHTMTHPRLTSLDAATAQKEIVESKEYLEKVIGKPVTSFCYPGGDYNASHVDIVRQAGFSYARTVKRFASRSSVNPLESATTVHAYRHWSDAWQILLHSGLFRFVHNYLNWDSLAISLFDKTLLEGGVFHLWGHSWEIDKNSDWGRLERVLAHIAGRTGVGYLTNTETV